MFDPGPRRMTADQNTMSGDVKYRPRCRIFTRDYNIIPGGQFIQGVQHFYYTGGELKCTITGE